MSETKNILMEELTIGTFRGQVQFFPDRRILKFLNLKCNPINKNLWPKVNDLTALSQARSATSERMEIERCHVIASCTVEPA